MTCEENFHQKNLDQEIFFPIFAVLYCPSLPTSTNLNRKPNAGMFIDIAKRMNIDLSNCYSIGDSPRDIEASSLVDCKAIGVRTGNGKKIESEHS